MPSDNFFPSSTPSRLRPLPAHILSAFAASPSDTPAAELTTMIAGIQRYQDHPFRRHMEPLDSVWRAGAAQLLFCPAADGIAAKRAIVLIPSMINRSDILDLLPERSFTRWLAGQGCAVYLLDWGDAVADAGQATIDSVIIQRLLPALAAAAAHHGAPVTALGYCMGGTLLAGAMALDQSAVDHLIFLASPWDFHGGDRLLQRQVEAGAPAALLHIEQHGVLPSDWLQTLFATLNADRIPAKFARFHALDTNSAAARLFVAVEDWLNDGVDMPGAVGRTSLLDWYQHSAPSSGQWFLDGKPVLPQVIKIPALIVTALQDRLVPTASALALSEQLPHTSVISAPIGHIGMMTSHRAKGAVWQPIINWLTET